MSDEKADVAIVGGGLAGLACARSLTRRGLHALVLEAGDAVGGRVRTDHVDGYTMDRGFQVLNTAYPRIPALIDIAALDMRYFTSGVLVRHGGALRRLDNPLHDPLSVAGALTSGRFRKGNVRRMQVPFPGSLSTSIVPSCRCIMP